jgi:hypothetical protein
MRSSRRASSFSDMQGAFARRRPDLGIFEPDSGTLVVVPSLTLAEDELRKVVGIQFYEERLLFLLLTLRRPEVRVVYLTSLPVDPSIVDYYLGFLQDPAEARQRLQLIALDDPAPRPLTHKLVERDDVVERVRTVTGGGVDAWLLPFNVTAHEQRFAQLVGLPIYGPTPELIALGSKSGSRCMARLAGVAVVSGFEVYGQSTRCSRRSPSSARSYQASPR